MIKLPRRNLPKSVRAQLKAYQNAIDGKATYMERVAQATIDFDAYKRKGNPTFDEVKKVLSGMCPGVKRCCYCEDSAADEIEHIKPKSLYPEATFIWENYLYSCGPCNGSCKRGQYAVFDQSTGKPVEVGRKKNAPIVPPVDGSPVFIDPRVDDPTAFLYLDLNDTYHFFPNVPKGTREYERAAYTIRILQLNLREHLPLARRQAFKDFRAHLARAKGASAGRLARIRNDIREHNHPAVWFEMKRQHQTMDSLRPLFADVPEALRW